MLLIFDFEKKGVDPDYQIVDPGYQIVDQGYQIVDPGYQIVDRDYQGWGPGFPILWNRLTTFLNPGGHISLPKVAYGA